MSRPKTSITPQTKTTRCISFYGSRDEIAAVKELARRHYTDVGRLLRGAMLEKYGDEFTKLLPSFDTSGSNGNGRDE